MEKALYGKRALVTGASSGIGQTIALAFAREGAVVAVHGRTEDRVAGVLDAIAEAGGQGFPVAGDLRNSEDIETLCRDALDGLGGIDIVVNNAGVADFGRLVDMDEETWDWMLDTNLKAPFLVTKHLLPAMEQQGNGGRLIYISSTAAKTADPEWTAYNASKHGVMGLVRCLAAEVGGSGITVNAICPGWIETRMAVKMHEKLSTEAQRPYAQVYEESMRTNMLGVIIPPEAIADFAVYLAGETGRFITAQAINICAGLTYW